MFAVSRETANIKNNKMPHISSNKKNKIDAIQQNQRNTTPFDGQHNGDSPEAEQNAPLFRLFDNILAIPFRK